MLDELMQYEEKMVSCLRCALCQTVCPIFKEEQNELASPRGKVRLIRELGEGRLKPSPRLKELLSQCLGCMRCAGNCPAKIPIDRLVLAARAEMRRQAGQPFLEKVLLRRVLGNRAAMMGAACGLLRAYRVAGKAATGLLPGGLKQRASLIPQTVPRSFFSRRRGTSAGNGKKRVGYFVGCLTDRLYPQVAEAMVGVLRKCGYDVLVPNSVACCGTPHWSAGDAAGARALALQNLNAFQAAGVEVIVTDCASCGSALQRYGEIYAGEARAGAFRAFSDMVMDISAFLVQEGLPAATGTLAGRVTYHDPCHLVRGMGVSTQPRQLLQELPGLAYEEMPEADQCCGGAGSFAIKHYDLSLRILDRKLDNIAATGADLVATSCPACRIQLAAGLQRRRSLARVVHPVELLARAIGIGKQNLQAAR